MMFRPVDAGTGSEIDIVNCPYVLHWTGATWSVVSIPGSNGYYSTQVVASSASNVWVLGTDADD